MIIIDGPHAVNNSQAGENVYTKPNVLVLRAVRRRVLSRERLE